MIAIYADQLLARGHDVTVVARGWSSPSIATRLRHIYRRDEMPAKPRETHFERMKARLIIVPHSGPIAAGDVPDADLVIATWWETAFEVVHFPDAKGRKIYFVQHHEVHSYLPAHISGASYLLPLRKIVVASWLVDTMENIYQDNDVALVPNGVDRSLFFAPERNRQSSPSVGLMYSSAPFKGFDIALSAIEIIRREHPDLRLIVFGSERPSSRLPLPRGAQFYLRPPQEYIKDIYASCDVFVVASRSEGFGLPILEAMACRTPVVTSLTGCAKDVIQDGRNGFAVDVENVDALASRVTDVLSLDDISWKAMSEAAYMTAKNYSWEESIKRFEEVLYKINEIDCR